MRSTHVGMTLPKVRIGWANLREYPTSHKQLAWVFVCQHGISVYPYKEDQLFHHWAIYPCVSYRCVIVCMCVTVALRLWFVLLPETPACLLALFWSVSFPTGTGAYQCKVGFLIADEGRIPVFMSFWWQLIQTGIEDIDGISLSRINGNNLSEVS